MITKKDWLLPIIVGALLGSLLLFLPQLLANLSQPKSAANAAGYADILEPVLPYTVSILTNKQLDLKNNALGQDPYFQKFLQAAPQTQSSLGSGIVLNEQGDIVTNAHVVNDADQVIVMTHQGAIAEVSKVLIDPETDIAVLQSNLRVNAPLPVELTGQYRVGDLVFSIGNPFGIGQSVSMGIISAKGRQQPGLTELNDFIQTDAAINPGNSGGALVDSQGRTIGMNTAIFSSTGGSQGIGFAIPINTVLSVAQELREHGKVSRGYLGIDVVELSPEESEQLNLLDGGLRVISIQQDSPAKKAGMAQGDIVIALNGVTLKSRTQAARLISQLLPGKETPITLLRDGETIQVMAVLSVRENR